MFQPIPPPTCDSECSTVTSDIVRRVTLPKPRMKMGGKLIYDHPQPIGQAPPSSKKPAQIYMKPAHELDHQLGITPPPRKVYPKPLLGSTIATRLTRQRIPTTVEGVDTHIPTCPRARPRRLARPYKKTHSRTRFKLDQDLSTPPPYVPLSDEAERCLRTSMQTLRVSADTHEAHR